MTFLSILLSSSSSSGLYLCKLLPRRRGHELSGPHRLRDSHESSSVGHRSVLVVTVMRHCAYTATTSLRSTAVNPFLSSAHVRSSVYLSWILRLVGTRKRGFHVQIFTSFSHTSNYAVQHGSGVGKGLFDYCYGFRLNESYYYYYFVELSRLL